MAFSFFYPVKLASKTVLECQYGLTMGENLEGLSVRDAADVAIEAIQRLSNDVGIPSGLKELGVKDQDFEVMAQNAMKDATSFTNPRILKLNEVVELYRRAM